MKYIIDSCSLIVLKDTYRESVFPDAWVNVENYIKEKKIWSCYEVYEDIKKQEGDSVFALIKEHTDIFIPPTKEIQLKVRELLSEYPNLIRFKNKSSGSDPFVIATAIIHKVPVVTEEKKTGDINNPHIPDVCQALNHPCVKLVDLFEREGFKFVNR
jgi:hypothetical protein